MEERKEQVRSMLRYYYAYVVKARPDEKEYQRSCATVDYLFDCGFSYIEILNVLKQLKVMTVTYDDLPDKLWEGSLIKRGAFYIHHVLRFDSPAPIFDIKTGKTISAPYFCEMKIRFTEDDLLDYFYSKIDATSRLLVDRKADSKAIKYFMQKLSKIDYVEPLDILVYSIDVQTKIDSGTERMIQVSDILKQCIEEMTRCMMELEALDLRRMVFRKCSIPMDI